MTRYLLDTAPLGAYLLGRQGARALITPWLRRDEAGTSILVCGEVIEHIMGRQDFLQKEEELRRLLVRVAPYYVDYPVLQRYAELRRWLRPPHGPGLIGDIDTLLAATALRYDLTLVTTDTDFRRVPSLQLTLLHREELR